MARVSHLPASVVVGVVCCALAALPRLVETVQLAELTSHRNFLELATSHKLTAFERVYIEEHPRMRHQLRGLQGTTGITTDQLYR